MLKMVVTRLLHVGGYRMRQRREKTKLFKMDTVNPTSIQQESARLMDRVDVVADSSYKLLFPKFGMSRIFD
jgi:hypothetical protein